jgi:hypothetical protein
MYVEVPKGGQKMFDENAKKATPLRLFLPILACLATKPQKCIIFRLQRLKGENEMTKVRLS